jgi:Xaa-Pro aminopeptidase
LQAGGEVEGFSVVIVDGEGIFSRVAEKAKTIGLNELGFEAGYLSYECYGRLRKAFTKVCRVVPAPPLVERLRMIKDRGEISKLRELARMTDSVIDRCKGHIGIGMTEGEIARRIETLAYEVGAEGTAFQPIVAAGPNSAMPHYHSCNGRLKRGSPLLIDFGLRLNGYNSDLTRTFHLGKLTRKYSKVYSTVLEAQQLALQRVKRGASATEVNACASDYIAGKGFVDFSGHGLGHGIGLEVHEAPRLNRNSQDTLKTGMVFTVEPGVYIPGWGGVRIEDMVLVTGDGYSVLTNSKKHIEDSLL